MANYYKEKQKGENFHDYIYKNNIKSSKNNNIKSLHSIINNLSNININLNVNVNINNSQKEKLLKSLSSNKIAQRKPNLSKDNNKNIKIYRKHVKNLSIDLGKDTPIKSSLDNFNIDDYNIVKSIGEGSFGKIFEVKDKYHRHFAMKKIIACSLKEVEIIKSEYNILYELSNINNNLIGIYGIETKKLDRSTFVINVLMELAVCDWEKEIIKRNSKRNYYTENELVLILKKLVNTFSALQKANVSHRDIKPQNILVCKGGILKIADFGEAKKYINKNNDNNTIKQTIRGTELYMSPILFNSLRNKMIYKYTKHNTYKSDVFSLGYCMLLATTLSYKLLCEIREVKNMNGIKKIIQRYAIKGICIYSENYWNVLYSMLELDERNRPDFIELEKRIEEL
jgi:serine/threonine protein kinase